MDFSAVFQMCQMENNKILESVSVKGGNVVRRLTVVCKLRAGF